MVIYDFIRVFVFVYKMDDPQSNLAKISITISFRADFSMQGDV